MTMFKSAGWHQATIQTDMDATRQHLQQAEARLPKPRGDVTPTWDSLSNEIPSAQAALEQVKETERQGASQLEAKVWKRPSGPPPVWGLIATLLFSVQNDLREYDKPSWFWGTQPFAAF